ncbi:lytic transglycosylase domain-containing protein [soil metagenome]
MSSKDCRAFVLAALLCAGLPAVADAQIYSWRDADGSLVLSTTPREGAVKTFAVVNVPSGIRTTRSPINRRAEEFEPLVIQHSSAHGVRADLVRAVIQAESAFNPRALSHKGAMGLMQLMPATAAELGVTNPYDPDQNIRGGVTYLKTLLVKYSQNEELALAAYNAGPGAVQKYGAVPPYRETRDYIARIKHTADVRPAAAKTLFRKVDVVDGRQVTTFSTRPIAEATRVSRDK